MEETSSPLGESRVCVFESHPSMALGLASALSGSAAECRAFPLADLSDSSLVHGWDLIVVGLPAVSSSVRRNLRSRIRGQPTVLLVDSLDVTAGRDLVTVVDGILLRDMHPSVITRALTAVLDGHFVLAGPLREIFSTEEVPLSAEEQNILIGLAQGMTDAELSRLVHVSQRTLRRRLVRLYQDRGVPDRLAAAVMGADLLRRRPGTPEP